MLGWARPLAVLVVTAVTVLGLASPAAATEPDTTPPTAPGTPVATDLTDHGFTLSWAPSTDAVGVVTYRVSTSEPPGSLVPYRAWQTPTNSIVITDLVPAERVNLWVRAYDAAGNASAFSPRVSVTTAGPADVTPPSAPGAPQASTTCTSVAICLVTLSWAPSTDDVGVMVYGVQEVTVYGGVVLGTSTTTSVTISGAVKVGYTYSFVVFAMDYGHNRSPVSAAVSVTPVLPAAAG